MVNLNPAFSFISTMPAGTVAVRGDTILQIPVIARKKKITTNHTFWAISELNFVEIDLISCYMIKESLVERYAH